MTDMNQIREYRVELIRGGRRHPIGLYSSINRIREKYVGSGLCDRIEIFYFSGKVLRAAYEC